MQKPDSKSVRLVILVRRFPNIVQTYVLNHILSMQAAGMETSIIAATRGDQDDVHPAVEQHGLLDKTLYIDASWRGLLRLPLVFFGSLEYVGRVARLLFSSVWFRHGPKYAVRSLLRARIFRNNAPDIVHSHSLFSSYEYLFLKEIFSIPFVTTFHGLLPNNIQMLEKEKIDGVLQAGDAFFVNTLFAKQQLLELDCPAEKIHIIPQGTDTRAFDFTERRIASDRPVRILSVGRLSVEKGFHVAIRAIARLKDSIPGLEYRIIGGGVEQGPLQALIDSLQLADMVTLCGYVSTDELKRHYREANIFILPSIDFRDGTHTETQGVVLQEAQASGIPVIASRTGGIPEVLQDEITGMLFDEQDDEGLAGKIARLVDDDQLYRSITLQAREDVEQNYSIDVISRRQRDVYDKLLGHKSAGSE